MLPISRLNLIRKEREHERKREGRKIYYTLSRTIELGQVLGAQLKSTLKTSQLQLICPFHFHTREEHERLFSNMASTLVPCVHSRASRITCPDISRIVMSQWLLWPVPFPRKTTKVVIDYPVYELSRGVTLLFAENRHRSEPRKRCLLSAGSGFFTVTDDVHVSATLRTVSSRSRVHIDGVIFMDYVKRVPRFLFLASSDEVLSGDLATEILQLSRNNY